MDWCCELHCDRPAEWSITPETPFGLYEQTYACTQHVGELLGSPVGEVQATSFRVQAIKQEAAERNCWRNGQCHQAGAGGDQEAGGWNDSRG